MTVENTNTATEAGLLFSYYIVLSFWAAQGLGMSLLSRNVAGQTKKSVAVTMNFVAWAAGNAIGKFFFAFFLFTPRVQEKKKKEKKRKEQEKEKEKREKKRREKNKKKEQKRKF